MTKDINQNLAEDIDKKFLHLLKIGLANREELSKYKLAFKDKENNVKFQQYRSHILGVFDKILDIITNNSAVYEKVKQEILKKYGTAKMDKDDKISEVLENKAELYGMDVNALIEVYNRGICYVEEYGVSNKTPDQYAFERVNSFLNDGEAARIDEDLMEAAKRGPGRPRTRPVKAYNVKSASNRSLAKVAAGNGQHARDAAKELARRKKSTATVPKRVAAKQLAAATDKTKTNDLNKMINAVPRGAVKAELRKVLSSKQAQAEKNKATVAVTKQDYNKMSAAMKDPKNKDTAKKWVASKVKTEKARPKPKSDITNHPDYESTVNSLFKSMSFGMAHGPEKELETKIKAHEKAVELLKKMGKAKLPRVNKAKDKPVSSDELPVRRVNGQAINISPAAKKNVISRLLSKFVRR